MRMHTSTQALDTLPPRERILLAAHQLFYSEGIRATGVDKIIERASVSKVTFYRQYPSKDDLIRAYLDYRHGMWMEWFTASLAQEAAEGTSAADALLSTLESWFGQPDFRGCAFLNAAAELGSAEPAILEVVRSHKQDMAGVLDAFFSADRASAGQVLALTIDGAIVHAQMGQPLDAVIAGVKASVEGIVCR